MFLGGKQVVPSKNYLIQQAATLLKFAKETRDHGTAAVLLEKAANFASKIDDPSLIQMDASLLAPDLEFDDDHKRD
jgi:hypothetical protein